MIFGKKQANQEAADIQRNLIIAYKQTFGSQMGKETLFDLMNRFHVLNSHAGDAFKEGQRSVVLHIMSNAAIDLKRLDEFIKGEAAE